MPITKAITPPGPSSGKSEFDGKLLPYEEYTNEDGFKTQYFLSGDSLAGVRSVGSDFVSEMVILELDQNIPDEIFEIPAGYEEFSW